MNLRNLVDLHNLQSLPGALARLFPGHVVQVPQRLEEALDELAAVASSPTTVGHRAARSGRTAAHRRAAPARR
jgi:hypothetical protein